MALAIKVMNEGDDFRRTYLTNPWVHRTDIFYNWIVHVVGYVTDALWDLYNKSKVSPRHFAGGTNPETIIGNDKYSHEIWA